MIKKENESGCNDFENEYNNVKNLINFILTEKPGEHTFGEEGETGYVITYFEYIAQESGKELEYKPIYSARLDSPPKFVSRGKNGGIMDIVDEHDHDVKDIDDGDGKTVIDVLDQYGQVVENPYRNLRLKSPRNVTFEKSRYPRETGDIGNVEIELEDNKGIGIWYYRRRK